jgi:hypothetical protein
LFFGGARWNVGRTNVHRGTARRRKTKGSGSGWRVGL